MDKRTVSWGDISARIEVPFEILTRQLLVIITDFKGPPAAGSCYSYQHWNNEQENHVQPVLKYLDVFNAVDGTDVTMLSVSLQMVTPVESVRTMAILINA